jgi:hypothetical protein
MSSPHYSRTKAIVRHAEKRAAQRYGVDPSVVKDCERLIKKERKFLARWKADKFHSNEIDTRKIQAVRIIHWHASSREQWRVETENKVRYRVVFDTAIERVVTFLPLRPEDMP